MNGLKYDAKRSTVPHFFARNLKVEFLTIRSSWSINLLIKSEYLSFSRLIQVISRFRFFALQMSKILMAFSCSPDLLLPDSAILLAAKLSVCQNKELLFKNFEREHREQHIASNSRHMELLYFSVLEKHFWINYFFSFFSKHVPIPELLASEYTFVIGNL